MMNSTSSLEAVEDGARVGALCETNDGDGVAGVSVGDANGTADWCLDGSMMLVENGRSNTNPFAQRKNTEKFLAIWERKEAMARETGEYPQRLVVFLVLPADEGRSIFDGR